MGTIGIIRNHNFRFHMNRESDRKAWEIIHGEEVRRAYRSQNDFVITAVNDYFDRHVRMIDDPYMETREKEDAFADRIVDMAEQKLLANIPALLGVFFINQGEGNQPATDVTGTANTKDAKNTANADVVKAVADNTNNDANDRTDSSEYEDNDLIDFDVFG